MSKDSIMKTAKSPVGIASILAVLGGGSFGSYTAVRNFIIEPLVTKVNDVIVGMKASEVRENLMIKNQMDILNYYELWTRLHFRKEDVTTVKKEMITEREWER